MFHQKPLIELEADEATENLYWITAQLHISMIRFLEEAVPGASIMNVLNIGHCIFQ